MSPAGVFDAWPPGGGLQGCWQVSFLSLYSGKEPCGLCSVRSSMRETSEQGRQGAPAEGPCRPSRGSEQPPPLHCVFSSRMGLGTRAGRDASPAPSDELPLSSPRLASCPASWPSAAPGHCPLQAPRAAPSITPTPATLGGELRRAHSVSGAPGWGQLGHRDRSTCPRCRVLQSHCPHSPGWNSQVRVMCAPGFGTPASWGPCGLRRVCLPGRASPSVCRGLCHAVPQA